MLHPSPSTAIAVCSLIIVPIRQIDSGHYCDGELSLLLYGGPNLQLLLLPTRDPRHSGHLCGKFLYIIVLSSNPTNLTYSVNTNLNTYAEVDILSE